MKQIVNIVKHAISTLNTNYGMRKQELLEHGIFSYIRNSSGYVLIIVLLISAVLVSVSTEFLITAQTNINYIVKFSDKLKASTIAKTGMNLGQFILEADKRGMTGGLLPQSVDKNIDCFQDLWALELPEMPIEQGSLRIRIYDENAKINLSILANEFVDSTMYYTITQRFFMNMGLPLDLADAIIDWVDIDDARFPYGAESADYYQNLKSPYKAKNNAMDSINELLLVKGITPEIFYGMGGGNFGKEDNLVADNMGKRELNTKLLTEMDPDNARDAINNYEKDIRNLEVKIGKEESRNLSDYFRVYGERSDYLSDFNKININTASYRVLSALTDNMTDDIVTEIIKRRMIRPFSNVNEVKDLITDENVLNNIVTVKSFIFKIVATGKVNTTTCRITGYYLRDEKRFLYWREE